MRFSEIHERAIARKGGIEELNALLPKLPPATALEARSDDRYLSEITRCVFKAGFVWRVIDNKWPGFEAAFHGFVPAYWQQVPPDVLEELAQDERIVRVSVHSTTFCHPGEFVPTVTSHFPTRGYSHEKAPHPGTVASPG